jgi:hypothetical protein
MLSMGLAEFKSAPARVVSMLTRSREKWKERVAAKQREIRRLRVKVRDLEVSREYWKQRALTPTAALCLPEDLGLGKTLARLR